MYLYLYLPSKNHLYLYLYLYLPMEKLLYLYLQSFICICPNPVVDQCNQMSLYPDPERVLVDIEAPVINAVKNILEVEVSGCFYHKRQCTWRKFNGDEFNGDKINVHHLQYWSQICRLHIAS